MNEQSSIYYGRHFPSEIIAQAVYLYHRFTLSLRDVEELLAMRGISVSYETIRVWCAHYGPTYAKRLRRRRGRAGDIWLLDEVSIVTIQGKRRYLWRAIDQDDDTIDILVQKHKDKQAVKRFFRKLLRGVRRHSQSHSHRQAEKLCSGETGNNAERPARPGSLCQQLLRTVPRADPGTRAANARM